MSLTLPERVHAALKDLTFRAQATVGQWPATSRDTVPVLARQVLRAAEVDRDLWASAVRIHIRTTDGQHEWCQVCNDDGEDSRWPCWPWRDLAARYGVRMCECDPMECCCEPTP